MGEGDGSGAEEGGKKSIRGEEGSGRKVRGV